MSNFNTMKTNDSNITMNNLDITNSTNTESTAEIVNTINGIDELNDFDILDDLDQDFNLDAEMDIKFQEILDQDFNHNNLIQEMYFTEEQSGQNLKEKKWISSFSSSKKDIRFDRDDIDRNEIHQEIKSIPIENNIFVHITQNEDTQEHVNSKDQIITDSNINLDDFNQSLNYSNGTSNNFSTHQSYEDFLNIFEYLSIKEVEKYGPSAIQERNKQLENLNQSTFESNLTIETKKSSNTSFHILHKQNRIYNTDTPKQGLGTDIVINSQTNQEYQNFQSVETVNELLSRLETSSNHETRLFSSLHFSNLLALLERDIRTDLQQLPDFLNSQVENDDYFEEDNYENDQQVFASLGAKLSHINKNIIPNSLQETYSYNHPSFSPSYTDSIQPSNFNSINKNPILHEEEIQLDKYSSIEVGNDFLSDRPITPIGDNFIDSEDDNSTNSDNSHNSNDPNSSDHYVIEHIQQFNVSDE